MNIDPRANASHLYAQSLANRPQGGQARGPAETARPEAATDKLQLTALERLRAEPDIRPDVVARGRELLEDPNYPSQEMVDAIAKLIVPFSDEE